MITSDLFTTFSILVNLLESFIYHQIFKKNVTRNGKSTSNRSKVNHLLLKPINFLQHVKKFCTRWFPLSITYKLIWLSSISDDNREKLTWDVQEEILVTRTIEFEGIIFFVVWPRLLTWISGMSGVC